VNHLFRLRPHLKRVLWAGDRLSQIFDAADPGAHPEGAIGEAMEAGALPGMESVAVTCCGRAFALDHLWKIAGPHLLGCDPKEGEPFPILVKRLDSGQKLSLQVHPDDAFAQELEGAQNGKSEAWVVLEADEGAGVWLGLNEGVSRADLETGLAAGDPMPLVRFLPLRPGDAVPVPAGCVHAISGGLLIFEVQQPSDHTYRLHDFGRLDRDGRPRELQIAKALQVIDPDLRPGIVEARPLDSQPGIERESLIELPSFRIERWNCGDKAEVAGGVLRVLHVENGEISARSGDEELTLRRGESLLVAAAVERLQLQSASPAGARILVTNPEIRPHG
jgi:mannose-6-phosphate isomerase